MPRGGAAGELARSDSILLSSRTSSFFDARSSNRFTSSTATTAGPSSRYNVCRNSSHAGSGSELGCLPACDFFDKAFPTLLGSDKQRPILRHDVAHRFRRIECEGVLDDGVDANRVLVGLRPTSVRHRLELRDDFLRTIRASPSPVVWRIRAKRRKQDRDRPSFV